MARPTRDLNFFYPTAEFSGYERRSDEDRFGVLRSIAELGSSTLIDIGSGPCRLFDWLRWNGYQTDYEAVDIREDSLRVCACAPERVYTRTPATQKDIVCLFATVSMNIDSDQRRNRNVLIELLNQAKDMNPKHIILSVIRKEEAKGLNLIQLVCYDRHQVEELIHFLNPRTFRIDETSYPSEYIVLCSF
jgi:hypothetical protein